MTRIFILACLIVTAHIAAKAQLQAAHDVAHFYEWRTR